jgi:dipeptidase D
MANVLGTLKPAPVWTLFEEICGIPRPSKHEQGMIDYVLAFAKSHDLDARVDGVGNVIVKKPATPGMENRKTVVLQSHLDMVPQKNQDVEHDFEKDPIRPLIDGDLVTADGTTLGADNGIGVATALAVLAASDLEHGPIEALLTIDEETGLTGAFGLKDDCLTGEFLFNLDSEDEGELCIGCAGGMDTIARIPYSEEATPEGTVAFRMKVEGLKGGHSGVDIHLRRGNSNKILNRVLWGARREMDLWISHIEGGDLRNAIPRYGSALVVVPASKAESFQKIVRTVTEEIRQELKAADPDLSVITEETALPKTVIDRETSDRFLNAVYACPDGVFAMLRDMPHITETSTNLGVVKSENGTITVVSLQRSSLESRKQDIANMVRSAFELAGGEVEHAGAYPGWQPDVDAQAVKFLQATYREKFGKEIEIAATHGGLECGLIRAVYPHMQAVSFGPTIRFPHSPDEHVEIPTVQRFWDFLVEALRQVPVQG